MSSTKRLLAILFALALTAAACGSDSDSEGTSTDAGAEGSSATDSTEGEETPEDEGSAAEAASDDKPSDASSDDCASEEVLCVGLVTDVGKVDDRSFNQSAWEGAEGSIADVAEFIETQAPKDYAANIETFVARDFDIVVTVGFGLGEATGLAAADNPEISFIGVDQFQSDAIANYTGLIFPEDQAGFMVGALAGLMTESNTVGFVGGTDLVPAVVAFGEGYILGVEHVNADASVDKAYHPGGFETGFTDPAWGANTARQMIDQGADVIFSAGGQTGNGGLAEVAKDGGDNFCIGVDSDQWNTLPEAHPCLISSAMKLITPGVSNLIELAAGGEAPGGNFFGEVAVAPYHDFESSIPTEVQEQVAEISAALLDGSLETGFTP